MSSKQVIKSFGQARANIRSRKSTYTNEGFALRMRLLGMMQVTLEKHGVESLQETYEAAVDGSWGHILEDAMQDVYDVAGVKNITELYLLAKKD